MKELDERDDTSLEGYECDSRCVYDYVDCMDAEGEASICKTRERNCFDECPL